MSNKFSKFINRLKTETSREIKHSHKGYGGMIFMITSLLSGITMLYAVTLSWNSNAIAMADNIAYITTVSTANELYTGNVPSFTKEDTNEIIKAPNGTIINPVGRYSDMLNSSRLIKGATPNPTRYAIKWNKQKGTCSIQFQGFETTVGDIVTPHRQEAVIENT